jgi:hypothetical protein
MSARELDRFRRAQERFESQQEADVAGQAEERREREREQEAREASQQASGDRRLREAADRRDREIAESARQREEGIAASDRQLREAAERQEIGGDGLLRAEARRQRQEAERERELFDRELEEAAAERQRELEEADRELFEAAERQQEQFEEEVLQEAIEAELDREERLRDLQPEPEPEMEMEDRIDRGVREPPSVEEFETRLGDIGESLARASSVIRGEFREAPPDIANIGEVIATGAEPEFIEPGGFRTGAVQSAGAIADVPGTALGLAEIGRFAGERGVEVATGEADQAVAETSRAFEAGIAAGREAVTERPVQTITTVGGSLLLSAGAFGAARAVGPRTGTAARFAVQPGEELLGRGGFAATRAVRGEAAAQRFFPQQEPLIFSEEAALRAGSRVVDRARAADVRVRGIGAGVPAFEVEFETEQDAATREMQERLLEAEQRRVVPMQDAPPRSDLSPEGTFFEPRGLDPRTRRRLRLAQEQELAQEIELETERLRTELELFDAIDEEALVEGINERAAEVELVQEITEVETVQEQPPFETELFRPPAELETEIPPREVERPPAETEVPPIEAEVPPREVEVEPIPFPQADDDEDRFRLPTFRGVRAIEAELRPAELDLE